MARKLALIYIICVLATNIFSCSSQYEPSIVAIAVGGNGNSSFAIKSDGSLWAWGLRGVAVYGREIGRQREYSAIPSQIMDDVIAVSAGGRHIMVIRSDGSLWGWGDNWYGQLGDGTTECRDIPVHIMDDIIYISAGFDYTLAIRSDKTLWGWGDTWNSPLAFLSGDCTIYPIEYHATPVHIMDDVIFVSAEPWNAMAIKSNGDLWDFQGGFDANAPTYSPTQFYPDKIMDDIVAVSMGFRYTMAIRKDGSLWAWGLNTYGQLGDGTTEYRDMPVHIMDDVIAVSASMISFRHSFTMAIQSDGSLWAWGSNHRGRLGNGDITDVLFVDQHSPVKIMEEVAYIAVGNEHTIALKNDGSLWAWGENFDGQLGTDGGRGAHIAPRRIMVGEQ